MKIGYVLFVSALLAIGCGPNVEPVANPASETTGTAKPSVPMGDPNAPPRQGGVTQADLDKMVAVLEDARKSGDKGKITEAANALGEATMKSNKPPKEMYPEALAYFREAQKTTPGDADSAKWIKTIEDIYTQMGRPIPK